MSDQTEPGPEPEADRGGIVLSQWEFIETIPTAEDVERLLKTLPAVWGVEYVEYADYVQFLPQRKKVTQPNPENPRAVIETYLDCFTMYMSVAGRIKMAEAAAERNGWRMDFVPEPVTPTGIPGYLSFGDSPENRRIVYREYVEVQVLKDHDGSWFDTAEIMTLGRKPGTAWVPYSGGSQAAGSNPYEKVETSARGRALAAWGFGVLPGSGVASIEEVLGAAANKRGIDQEQSRDARQERRGGQQQQRQSARPTREAMISDLMTVGEELRQVRRQEQEVFIGELAAYLSRSFGVQEALMQDGSGIDWSKVNDGQIQLTTNALRTALAKEGSPI